MAAVVVQAGKDQPAEIARVDDRQPSVGRQRHHALPRDPEQLEHLAIARPVNGGWADDRPVAAGRDHRLFRFGLRCAVGRKRGLARGQGRDMEEARDARAGRGGDHSLGADDIALMEGVRVAVDHARNVDHRVATLAQGGQAIGPVERAFDPGHAVQPGLGAARQRLDVMALGQRRLDQVRAEEAGAAGDREPHHSRTRWSQWTKDVRGA